MDQSEETSKLAALQKLTSQFSSLGEDYIFTRVTTDECVNMASTGPMRVSGIAWILCLEGRLEVEVNLKHATLVNNSLMVLTHESLVEIKESDARLDCFMLFVSPKFMQTTNIDPNVLGSLPPIPAHKAMPLMTITDTEVDLMRRYFELIHQNTMDNTDELYVRSISRNLISAMLNQVIQFVARRIETIETPKPRSRRSVYVNDFFALVHKFHRSERSVGFYAGKLFISPKYLSLLVKENTGRSAAEWIDEFVILEAKNLLRFSGKNVQQVSYELNFVNQSSFGKYFKHLTGMSPTEYQRS